MNKIFAGASRLRIHALRAVIVAFYIVLWSAVPFDRAFAYVDPSVMTYTIQAIAGVAVALSAVAGVAFRRTRRKIYQIAGVDENANKISEDELQRIDPDSPDARQRYDAAEARAREKAAACDEMMSTGPKALSRKARFAFALVTCVFFAFIVLIAPALEIFGSNSDSLVFSLGAVWWIPVVFCLTGVVLLAAVLTLLKGRAFYTALMIIFGLGLAAYVQSLFLNQGMMPADGGFIGWTDWHFVSKMIISGIVWIVLVVGIVVASHWHAHALLKGITALGCAIMLVQLVGVISVALDYSQHAVSDAQKPYVTRGGLLSVSPKNNTVVFVLDTYDTSILDEIIAEDPNYLDNFNGFTYFHNSLGTMVPTTNAIPNLLTGLKPAPGQSVGEYRATKYERSAFLSQIRDLGFSMGLYTDSLMMDDGNPADLAIAAKTLNVHPVSRAPIEVWRTFIAMEQCALYREAPWVLKPVFWYYTSDINNRMIADSSVEHLDDSLYELDDAAILRMLQNNPIAADDNAETGAFRFIHLFGPHFPFSVDENGENVGTNKSDQVAQAKGSMRVVFEYMDQLKKLGLYDDATIIVTADHGVWSIIDDPVPEPVSPIMLAKPAQAGSSSMPAVVSEAPVSHDDFQATVIEALGGDASPYGQSLFQVSDPERVRYYDALTTAGGDGQRFVEYAVTGNALDISNWQKTGQTWKDE